MDEAASIRLNKALADAGVASRRQADALIAAGRVTINGTVVTELGRKVVPGRDALAVDGKSVSLRRDAGNLTLMLHKRPGCVTTARDPEGRPTVFDALPARFRKRRLFSVGRLDYFSEGLLLLTTDGELAFRLAHPRWHVAKRYRVTVRGAVGQDTLDAMARGMTLAEGEALAPVPVRIVKRLGPDRFVLELELSQGVNRQVRRMCRDLGLTVLKLVRIAQGTLALGDLPPGECRELTAGEQAALRRAVGLEGESSETRPKPAREITDRPAQQPQQKRRATPQSRARRGR
jgi:23S rRNA pseudouridine2605 synthase